MPDLPDTCVRSWRYSGWNHGHDRVRLLELMGVRGEVAVLGRQRRDKVYELAERVYPTTRWCVDPGLPADVDDEAPGRTALPVLHDEGLVGKVDATAEAHEGVLRVDAVHEDAPWSREVRDAVDVELAGLASWLGPETMRLDRR